MERPNMEEGNNRRKRSEMEEVNLECFVYTSETQDADIPKATLTHLRVDSSVREIPAKAFSCCKSLKHLRLPETLTSIGKAAFYFCDLLESVQFVSDSSPETYVANPSLEAGTIVFPETANLHIDNCAFSHCHSLRKVIISSVSTRLGTAVFRDCDGLFSIELPEGLQAIGMELLCCQSLTTVKIPSSVCILGDSAFFQCRSLTSVDLPHGLLALSDGAFMECFSIETLHIPSTVASIGKYAFNFCSSLKHIKLPPTLEIIEDALFFECKSLEYIEIPSTVKRIEERAFCGCSSLSHVRVPRSIESIGFNPFIDCSSLISIELPEGFFLFGNDLFLLHSLVNIAVPPLAGGQRSYSHDFVVNSKLGSVANGYDDLIHRLKHRFESSPVNKLCYYQSYHSSENAMLILCSLMEDDPMAAVTQVDGYGMTPLPVLSLSQIPNMDMLLAVLKAGPADHIVRGRDAFGSTPMDYLCFNRMPNSTDVIRRVLQTRFDYFLGMDRSSSKSDTMFQAVDEALAVDWSLWDIGRLYFRLAKYERKEILSLLELCLWKIKIDENSFKEQTAGDRGTCRINSGAAVVIPHVLPFLDKVDAEDYVVSSPDE